MKKNLLRMAVLSAACAGALCLAPGLQSSAAAAVDAKTVQYKSGDANLDAYLVRPKGGKHPAIVLVHDEQGLTPGIQALAQKFAEAGFVVLAPNLVSRLNGKNASTMVTTVSGPRRGTPVSPLDIHQTVDDVEAAFAVLQKDSGVDPSKISAVGVGWGGWRTFKLAADEDKLHRAVIFYGVTPDDGSVEDIKAPVMEFYAQGDFLVSASALITKKWMKDKFSYTVLPNSDHGFLGGGGGTFDLVAAAGEGVDLDTVARKAAMQAAAAAEPPPAGNAAAAKTAMDQTLKFLKN